MSTPKQFRVTLNEKPFLPYEGEYVDMPFDKFVATVGGELATALFEGKFKSVLYTVLSIAQSRGKKEYHERLVKEGKEIQPKKK